MPKCKNFIHPHMNSMMHYLGMQLIYEWKQMCLFKALSSPALPLASCNIYHTFYTWQAPWCSIKLAPHQPD